MPYICISIMFTTIFDCGLLMLEQIVKQIKTVYEKDLYINNYFINI